MSATQFRNFLQPGGTTRVITATHQVGSIHVSAANVLPTAASDAANKASPYFSPSQKAAMQNKGWQILNQKREHHSSQMNSSTVTP